MDFPTVNIARVPVRLLRRSPFGLPTMAPSLIQLLAVSNLVTAAESATHSGELSERQQAALTTAIDLTIGAFHSSSSPRNAATARQTSRRGGEAS